MYFVWIIELIAIPLPSKLKSVDSLHSCLCLVQLPYILSLSKVYLVLGKAFCVLCIELLIQTKDIMVSITELWLKVKL